MTADQNDDTVASDVDNEHEEEHPKGTMLFTMLFLLMCFFMFAWAYYILLLRV